MEEWISLNEFRKRYKLGYEVALNLIYTKQVECTKTPGGRYKIKVGGNTVSREMYEKERQRRINAEKQLEALRKMVGMVGIK